MRKWYTYTLALLVDGEIKESSFVGRDFEMDGRFIRIERQDGITTLLNYDIVGQLDIRELTNDK